MLTRRAPKKTSFVPRSVFRVAVTGGAGVIPLCVTAGFASLGTHCGGVAFMCYGEAACGLGVADVGFKDVKTDHSVLHDGALGVADIGFTDVTPDRDAGAPHDGPFGVADIGFSDVTDGHSAG